MTGLYTGATRSTIGATHLEDQLDALDKFKQNQREGWAHFGPLELITTAPAAQLVRFARVRAGDGVLDVGCGTGVVAVTAARAGRARDGARPHARAPRARAGECHAGAGRRSIARGGRRAAAVRRQRVRRRAQPVRPHVRAAPRCRHRRDAARAEAGRHDSVLDLAARDDRRPHVRSRGEATHRPRRPASRRRRNGAIPTSFATVSATT